MELTSWFERRTVYIVYGSCGFLVKCQSIPSGYGCIIIHMNASDKTSTVRFDLVQFGAMQSKHQLTESISISVCISMFFFGQKICTDFKCYLGSWNEFDLPRKWQASVGNSGLCHGSTQVQTYEYMCRALNMIFRKWIFDEQLKIW